MLEVATVKKIFSSGSSLDNFINALRSPQTKRVYVNSLRRYMKHLKITDVDSLLLQAASPKVIEAQLIDYIMSLRQDGIAYATIQHLIAPVFTFYQLNDVVINRRKVHRYLGECKRVVKDRVYTMEQIQQALQNADQRMRMIILILASTGCRIGALPGLTLGNLTKLPDYGLYKITFYEGTNNEYYSFTTRECAQTGIDNYLLYRQRCGEKLVFNQSTHSWEPSDTPLIRLSFDATDSFQASRQVKPIGYQGLKRAINLWTPVDEYDGGLSALDERIKGLNHAGYSARAISEILKSDPEAQGGHGEGWGLGRSAVHERLKEMRLDPRHEIRVNFKRRGGIPKEKQKWYKIITILKKETAQYTTFMGFKPMVRTMFYQMRDEGYVKDNEYKSFVKYAADARLGYSDQEGELLLPRLPYDCFEDDSRESIDDYDDSEPQEMIPPSDIPDEDEYLDQIIEDTKNAPANYEGAGEEGYDGRVGGFWFGQPEYVEVWTEKIGLTKGHRKILKDVHVTIKGNKGYSSLAFLHQCTQELKELIDAKGFKPSDVTILYTGDWDPSGENIDYYLKRRLRQLGLEGINFVRVGITPEQIDKYHFPLLPVEKDPDKKKANPNMAEFVRRHGYKATHINAFFTRKYLKEFKKIILAEVYQHWYQEIYDVMKEVYDVKAEAPEQYTDEALKEIRQEMYQKITEAFVPGWYRGLQDAPDGEGGEGGGR